MKFNKEGLANFFASKPNESCFGDVDTSIQRMAKLLPVGANILDLGAGDGRNALYLAEQGFVVQAVDLSEAGIQKLERLAAAHNVSLKTEVADIQTYEIQGEYDAIVVALVLQFVSEEAALRVLTAVKAHTRPGGFHMIRLLTSTGDRKRLDLLDDPASDCFYPANGWIKTFYNDWNIVRYHLSRNPLIGKFHSDGTPMTNNDEAIIAQKPE